MEDESRMASLIRRALREERHAVDVAADGAEGLWQDDWGFPIVSGDPVPSRLLADARVTVRACPRLALGISGD